MILGLDFPPVSHAIEWPAIAWPDIASRESLRPSDPATVSAGVRIVSAICEAMENVPIGWRCANTVLSARATTACAAMPMYGSSDAGVPSRAVTRNRSG